MAAKRGPTNTKRQRERTRNERKVKKEQRKIQRQSDKENGIVREAADEDSPPEEISAAV